MTAQKPAAIGPLGALGAFGGFVAMSVVAGILTSAAVTPAIALTGAAAHNTIGIFDGLPEYLKVDQLAQPTTIFAKSDDGSDVPLATFYAQNRQPVAFDELGQHVKDAAIAAEDPRFFSHGGVDIEGTIRGALFTALSKDVQGGSSITQQYVKNVLLQKCEAMGVKSETDKSKYDACVDDATGQSPDRKLREMKLAIGLEKKFSKDQILTGYLNIAGFGGSVYGIQAAAKYYFNADATNLTASQAASLIAIVNSPSALKLDEPESKTNGEANGYAANKTRRDYILKNMLSAKMLTRAQFNEAVSSKIEPSITPTVRGCQSAGEAAYFCDYVQKFALNDPAFGKDADARAANFSRGGYKIYSTLDLSLQADAQKAVRSRIPATFAKADLGGAAVGVQPGTGRVLFMTQSKNYSQDPSVLHADPSYTAINWNTDHQYGGSSGFQVGSTYKAFTLAEWLNQGHSLYETVNANPKTYSQSSFTNSCGTSSGQYTPANDTAGEGGTRSALNATVNSINTAYVAMAYQLDLCKIRKQAEAFGVHPADRGQLDSNPSSVLGTNTISPLTMATAYAAIANKGVVCSPVAIDKIVDASGQEIAPTKSDCTQAVDPRVAATMAYALRQVVTSGTAAASNPGGHVQVLGKTGTTDNAEQLWLVEASTKVATAFWTGNIVGHASLRSFSVPDSAGHSTLASLIRNPVVHDIMSAANAKYGGDPFPAPEQKLLAGSQVKVPDLTGKSVAAAQSIVEGLGLTFANGGSIDSALTSGVVASSNPSTGSGVTKGSTITVYTSNGALVILPNVVGMTLDKATAALNGFTVRSAGGSGDPNDTVSAMDPGAGTVLKPGSVINLSMQAAAAGID
jgi:membrane peptidoglycan carboxypeptidase